MVPTGTLPRGHGHVFGAIVYMCGGQETTVGVSSFLPLSLLSSIEAFLKLNLYRKEIIKLKNINQ